jgi:hypothetical protein
MLLIYGGKRKMAITDLTGTKWKLNNLPISTENFYNYDITFKSNNTTFTSLSVAYDVNKF